MLLRELLFLEVELKQSSGESVTRAGYTSRFPQAASDIDAAFTESGNDSRFIGACRLDPATSAIPLAWRSSHGVSAAATG